MIYADHTCEKCGGIVPSAEITAGCIIRDTLCPRCARIMEENERAARQGKDQGRLLV